jgi:hypothetical protein
VQSRLPSNSPRCDQLMSCQVNAIPCYATHCYGWLDVVTCVLPPPFERQPLRSNSLSAHPLQIGSRRCVAMRPLQHHPALPASAASARCEAQAACVGFSLSAPHGGGGEGAVTFFLRGALCRPTAAQPTDDDSAPACWVHRSLLAGSLNASEGEPGLVESEATCVWGDLPCNAAPTTRLVGWVLVLLTTLWLRLEGW